MPPTTTTTTTTDDDDVPPTTTTSSTTTTTSTTTSTTSTSTTSTTVAPTLTAWGLIQAEPTVSDFAAAVQRFDLTAVLDTPGQPVTALVPTNAAIAALPDGSAILADPVAFEAFLRSHTVAGSLTTEQIFARAAVDHAGR